ncbi:hypothetical protein LRB11_05120 [Ectothiorhodospira haloalkaliphila]|nr:MULTISPECIES: hypothetical protein [Ectothiorhodospira]MCG5498792.1 hypothetical protein [Ectothiorhodospira variabilis]MCG5524311.1 hypothetical protein [Ectothiorhodospira haloalkaliphila]
MSRTEMMPDQVQRAVELLESLPEPYQGTAVSLLTRLVDDLSAVPEKRARQVFAALEKPGMTDSEVFAKVAELSFVGRQRSPTLQESLQLSHTRSLHQLDRLMSEAGGSCGLPKACELLGGISRQALEGRIERGTILWARIGGERRFPLAQFDITRSRVHPGVREVLGELRHVVSPVGQLVFFLAPKPALDGRRPIDLVRTGDRMDEVKRAARLYLEQSGI